MTPPANAPVVPIDTQTSAASATKTGKSKDKRHSSTSTAPDALKCMMDVCDIPNKYFLSTNDDGTKVTKANGHSSSKGAALRKLVLTNIARFANPDGSDAYPSIPTLLKKCTCSERQLHRTIDWLIDAALLKLDGYKAHLGTNIYRVLIPKDPAIMMATSIPNTLPSENDTLPSENDTLPSETNNPAIMMAPNRPYRPSKPSLLTVTQDIQDFSKDNGQEQTLQQQTKRLARKLSELSKGEVKFGFKFTQMLTDHLSEFSFDDLVAAFTKEMSETPVDNMCYLAKNFCETADQIVLAMKSTKAQKEREAAAVALTTEKIQREAEAERIVRQKAREAEEALIEEDLPN